MYEELIKQLKYLATIEVKNGESVLHISAEATAAIREIAQEAADAIEATSKAYQMMSEAYEAEVTESRWIPTKKQYPFAEYGEGKSVLTVDSMGEERVLYFDGSNWCWPTGEPLTTARQFPITHWMPCPQPPKEADMSERREKKTRYNQRLAFIAAFEKWLQLEPPVWMFFSWRRWLRSRPIWSGAHHYMEEE